MGLVSPQLRGPKPAGSGPLIERMCQIDLFDGEWWKLGPQMTLLRITGDLYLLCHKKTDRLSFILSESEKLWVINGCHICLEIYHTKKK